MKNCSALVLTALLGLFALPPLAQANGAKGPWAATEFPVYPATDALSEAKARFQLLNNYAMAFLFWRVEIAVDPQTDTPPDGSSSTSIDWRQIENDPTWGPWLKLARASRVTPTTISFGSESREPGSFFIDGQVRVAKTGSEPGSPIVVNEDLITRTDDLGETAPLDYLEIVAILVHEHGHHLEGLGVKLPHEELDRHGAAVREFLQKSFRQLEYGQFPPDPVLAFPKRPALIFTGYHDFSQCDLRIAILKDAAGLHDLTPIMDNEKMCYPHPERQAPHTYPPLSNLTRGPQLVQYTSTDAGLEAVLKSGDRMEANEKAIFKFHADSGGGFLFDEIDR